MHKNKSQKHWNKVSTLVKGMPPRPNHHRHPPASPTRLLHDGSVSFKIYKFLFK